jgi:mannosylglycoprotein endo-beta-mannosidase
VVIEGVQNLLDHATKYYKELFGPEPGNGFRLDPEIWEGYDKLSDDDNRILCQPFSEAEIKTALFQMEKNKAPGPDKMPIKFYQCYWVL